jgi:hypothetical protein
MKRGISSSEQDDKSNDRKIATSTTETRHCSIDLFVLKPICCRKDGIFELTCLKKLGIWDANKARDTAGISLAVRNEAHELSSAGLRTYASITNDPLPVSTSRHPKTP